MKVCYLILTHRNPAQISRLVTTVLRSSPNGFILLVHDRKGCALQGLPWLSDPRVAVLHSSTDIHRGEFSMVAAYLEGLAWLQTSPWSWDWIVCLSGQDYPVRPLVEVEAFLARACYDAFLLHWMVGGPDDRWLPRQGRIRYGYRHRKLPLWAKPLLEACKWTHNIQSRWRIFTTYGAHLGTRCDAPPFNATLPLRGGSQWHYLRRRCVDYLLDFCRRRPDVVDHYRHCIVPDESFLQTILVGAGTFSICNDNRRYIDWRGCKDGHPQVLTVADVPALDAERYDFARKFDPDIDAGILDLLDLRIFPEPRNSAAGAQASTQTTSVASEPSALSSSQR